MKRVFNWLLILGAIVGAVYMIGLIVPRVQAEGSTTNLQSKLNEVFQTFSDLETWPHWHPDVASVSQLSDRRDHPAWRVTDKQGQSYEVEITLFDEAGHWAATFDRDDSHVVLHLDLSWYGEGTRVRVSQQVDTRDPWQRARHFFLPQKNASSLSILLALSKQLGEKPAKIEN